MIDRITRDDFSGLEPGTLALLTADQRIPLAVSETRELPARSSRASPFAVVLRGPQLPAVPQGIHKVSHPRQGELDLFIVPIAQGAQHTDYELIFN